MITVEVLAAGYQLGTGRTVPTIAAAVGLAGLVLGAWAWRSGRTGRVLAMAGVVLGVLAGVVGGLHAANAAGGLGTGNGLAGAVVAVVLGVAAVAVGGLALRPRRAAAGSRQA